jgi:hypothetical protein
MSTPIGSPLPEADLWISRTPYDPAEVISQSEFVRNRMSIHQGNSPISMVSVVNQLAKGTELMAHRMTLMEDKLRTLRKTNEALAKRRKVKRTRLQARGTLTIETAQVLITAKATGGQQSGERSLEERSLEGGLASQRRYSNYSKPGHNIRTCQELEETSDEASCIECN